MQKSGLKRKFINESVFNNRLNCIYKDQHEFTNFFLLKVIHIIFSMHTHVEHLTGDKNLDRCVQYVDMLFFWEKID